MQTTVQAQCCFVIFAGYKCDSVVLFKVSHQQQPEFLENWTYWNRHLRALVLHKWDQCSAAIRQRHESQRMKQWYAPTDQCISAHNHIPEHNPAPALCTVGIPTGGTLTPKGRSMHIPHSRTETQHRGVRLQNLTLLWSLKRSQRAALSNLKGLVKQPDNYPRRWVIMEPTVWPLNAIAAAPRWLAGWMAGWVELWRKRRSETEKKTGNLELACKPSK